MTFFLKSPLKAPRVIPALMFAGVCLLALKVTDLAGLGQSAMAQSQPETAQQAEQNATQTQDQPADLPDVNRFLDDVPGLAKGTLPPEGRGYVTEGKSPESPHSNVTSQLSPAERALLERLSQRREELDAREQAIVSKENLLEAAEKRIEARIKALEELEARIASLSEEQDAKRKAQVAGLVTMYENMKPKDAARIFDRLQLDVLLSVVEEMKPRTMSAILAQMEPENAERLTIAIARKNAATAAANENSGRELQQIGG